MGLDMYLNKVKKVPEYTLEEMRIANNEMWNDKRVNNTDLNSLLSKPDANELLKPLITHPCNDEYTTIFTEVGYWRKVNAIHRWFVENVQYGADDCGDYEVGKHQIERLLKIVKKTIKTKDPNLLPTGGGFFFGSTEYDEWYWDSLRDTVEILEKVLETVDFNNEILFYHSSW